MDNKIVMEGYTFDDVLLIPRASEVLPNEVELKTKIGPKLELDIPFMSSAMDTVTESEMAIAMAKKGGMGIIHKNMTIEKQVLEVKKVKLANKSYKVGAAIGIGQDMLARVNKLFNVGVDAIVLDSAHGHSKNVIESIKLLRENFSKLCIIGGNVATKKAAKALIKAGVDIVKVGIGPGSICTTRVISGVGVPQLTAIIEVANYCKKNDIGVIADGGIKYSGDVTKAIAAGADCVMLGSIFAGCDEAPGEIVEYNNKKYKKYVGMGSIPAMERGAKDRYFQTGVSTDKLVPEGIEGMVESKGKLENVIYQLCGGLKSGMGYCGTKTIAELKEKGKFVKITSASLKESHPHNVIITEKAPNY